MTNTMTHANATQTDLTLEEVNDNILKWNDIRKDEIKLKFYLEENNPFKLDPFIPTPECSDYLHFYPAITADNKFVMYVIKALDDKVSLKDLSNSEFNSKIKKLTQETIFPTNINPAIAHERIAIWNHFHNAWIDEQVKSEFGVFRAFTVHAGDLPVNETLIVNLGLRFEYTVVGSISSDQFVADLIFGDENYLSKYYDTTKPVPPYSDEGNQPTSECAFFLLTLPTT